MWINLGFSLATPHRPAGAMPTQGSAHTASVAELARDMVILDSDLARGNNAAALPLTGTTDAPDGGIIQARAVSTDDGGATTTPWQDVATAAGGAWSGTLAGVPRSSSWYRAEVRVKGSTAPAAQMTNRFGSGFVVMFFGASNTDKGTDQKGPRTPPLETIGISATDPQFFFWTERNNVSPGVSVLNRQWVNDSNAYTSQVAPIRAMAATFRKLAPGLKVHAVFDSQSGSPEIEALCDGIIPRTFSEHVMLVDDVTAAGGAAKLTPVGACYLSGTITNNPVEYAEWIMAAFWGRDLSGNPIPAIHAAGGTGFANYSVGGYNLNHCWFGSMPELLTGRTQVLFQNLSVLTLQGSGGITASLANTEEGRLTGYTAVLSATPGVGHILPNHDAAKRGISASADSLHIDDESDEGFAENFRASTTNILHGVGLVPQTYPQIDIIQWNANWLRIGSTTGPITTRWRKANGGGATNFRGGLSQALGFWTSGFGAPTRTEIRTPNPDGSPGALAAAGDVYIYPESGQTFDGLSQIFWHVGGSYPGAMDYTWGENTDGNGGGHWHIPIVDVGHPNLAGLMLQPRFDHHSFINDANTLPAPSTFQVTTGSPRFRSAANITAVTPGLTVEVTATRSPGATLRLLAWPNDANGLINVSASGQLRVMFKSSNLTRFDQTTAAAVSNSGQMQRIRVAISLGNGANGQVRIFVDDIEQADANFGTVTFQNAPATFRGGELLESMNKSATAANVAAIRIWHEYLTPGTTPVTGPVLDVTASGSVPLVGIGTQF